MIYYWQKSQLFYILLLLFFFIIGGSQNEISLHYKFSMKYYAVLLWTLLSQKYIYSYITLQDAWYLHTIIVKLDFIFHNFKTIYLVHSNYIHMNVSSFIFYIFFIYCFILFICLCLLLSLLQEDNFTVIKNTNTNLKLVNMAKRWVT